MEGATGGFYAADDNGPGPESPLATVETHFIQSTRTAAVDVEPSHTADPDVADAADRGDAPPPSGETLDQAINRIRAMRRPLGSFNQKLALRPRRGYHRHWFNDVAGRIEDAKLSGWAHVLGTDNIPIKRCVGTGRDNGALFAFAMELPEVFWEEDQAARHAEAQGKIDALKAAPFRAPQGAAKPTDKGKFYDPTEHDAGPVQVVKSN
jgi:hypothetical protein